MFLQISMHIRGCFYTDVKLSMFTNPGKDATIMNKKSDRKFPGKIEINMACTVCQEDIKRAKALGCLNNKGTDLFNIRVITVNGKIATGGRWGKKKTWQTDSY